MGSQDQDQHYEIFVERFTKHEADIRRFIRSLLPTWNDVDEVVQQTALVFWKKFDQYDPDTHFMKWACVIARFEALSFRRKMAREKLVFRDDILELMADEGMEELDQRSAEHEALQTCLANLPENHHKLLTLAYTPGVKIVDLAEEAGSTSAAFYMKLKRLRGHLMTCIESRLSPDPLAP